jgi:hypothetical protein
LAPGAANIFLYGFDIRQSFQVFDGRHTYAAYVK